MIDWNKRNGGFLAPESVYEGQLSNLSSQIDELRKENNKLNNIINEAINGTKDFYLNDDEYTKYDYTLAYKIYHILKGDNK